MQSLLDDLAHVREGSVPTMDVVERTFGVRHAGLARAVARFAAAGPGPLDAANLLLIGAAAPLLDPNHVVTLLDELPVLGVDVRMEEMERTVLAEDFQAVIGQTDATGQLRLPKELRARLVTDLVVQQTVEVLMALPSGRLTATAAAMVDQHLARSIRHASYQELRQLAESHHLGQDHARALLPKLLRGAASEVRAAGAAEQRGVVGTEGVAMCQQRVDRMLVAVAATAMEGVATEGVDALVRAQPQLAPAALQLGALPIERARMLASHPDDQVRCTLAMVTGEPTVLTSLVHDDNTHVRRLAMANPATPLAVARERFRREPAPAVRAAFAGRPDLSVGDWDVAQLDQDEAVRAAAAGNSHLLPFQQARPMAGTVLERAALAANPRCTEQNLATLRDDPAPEVIVALVERGALPASALDALLDAPPRTTSRVARCARATERQLGSLARRRVPPTVALVRNASVRDGAVALPAAFWEGARKLLGPEELASFASLPGLGEERPALEHPAARALTAARAAQEAGVVLEGPYSVRRWGDLPGPLDIPFAVAPEIAAVVEQPLIDGVRGRLVRDGRELRALRDRMGNCLMESLELARSGDVVVVACASADGTDEYALVLARDGGGTYSVKEVNSRLNGRAHPAALEAAALEVARQLTALPDAAKWAGASVTGTIRRIGQPVRPGAAVTRGRATRRQPLPANGGTGPEGDGERAADRGGPNLPGAISSDDATAAPGASAPPLVDGPASTGRPASTARRPGVPRFGR